MTRRWPVLAFLAFLVVPILEVWVILRVGRAIGGWETFAILVLWSLLGAWIVRREWSHAWSGLTTALRTGHMPARELADAGLVLIGGALLLAPGFLTDALGLLLILPITRPVFRRVLQAAVARRVLTSVTVVRSAGPAGSYGPGGSTGAHRRTRPGDEVIEGEIVDE